jgi:ribulose-5-phosphate 4-epimerase/fuculose-1-phosphate aldolase
VSDAYLVADSTKPDTHRFAERGFDEGVAGHISVRDPILTDHFWLNPLSQHFSQISVSDLILVNEDGDVVIGDEPINAAAFAIHSESMYLSLQLQLSW